MPQPESASEAPEGNLTIEQLVAAAQSGEHDAWMELMYRYGAMVWKAAADYRLREADAADAVQNTWLNAVAGVRTIREPARFGGWLRVIARNECHAVWTQNRRERPTDRIAEDLAEPDPGPETLVVRADTAGAVRSAVRELPESSRVVIEGLFFEPGMGYTELAVAAGIAVGSVGPTRARAFAVLRRRLQHRGLVPEQRAARAG